MKHLFTVLFLFVFIAARSQPVVYVTPTGSGNQSGGSWADALPGAQLQSRLATASSGTQFWVATGTYRPTTGADRTISFFIPSGVQVYGGFVGTETSLASRKVARPSGSIFTGNHIPGNHSTNSYHVVTFKNANPDTRLDGITINAGSANLGTNFNDVGGGIYNDGSNGGRSEPTIFNCQIQFNTASANGGGIYNNGYAGICALRLVNCFIESNQAIGGFGGGVCNNGTLGTCNTMLINCFVGGNSAVQGSAMFNEGLQGVCSPVITNCIFKGNMHSQAGGGVLFNRGINGTCRPTITNSIFWQNPYSRPSIHNDSASPVVTYSDIEDGYPGTGNISQDPKFFNYYRNDFRLLKSSPAINSGDPASTSMSVYSTDFEGKSRILNGRIDMGTIEFVPNSVTGVVRVSQSGSGDFVSGSSWSNALDGSTLRSALSEAAPNTIFWLAGGLYRPTFTVGDRASSFSIPSDVQVYGGFVGNESDLNSRVITQPLSTSLSGEIDFNDKSDNSYHVVTFRNASANTRLDGVVITGGNANGTSSPDNSGGGVYNEATAQSVSIPTIVNCLFTNNNASNGAGLYNVAREQAECSPIIKQCSFIKNIASSSGDGATTEASRGNSNPQFIDSRFIANESGSTGGAFVSQVVFNTGDNKPVLTNCVFENNRSGSGGAVLFGSSFGAFLNPILVNCIFANNQAINTGGAIQLGTFGYSDNNPAFTNCTFFNNSASSGGGIYANRYSDSYVTIRMRNSVFRNNTFAYSAEQGRIPPTYNVTYSNIQGSFAGAGNIDQDPLFVDAGSGNYRLRAGSPSINSGDPTSSAATVSDKDLDGNMRIAENRIDMGAYEFQVVSQTGSDLSLSLQVGNRTPGVNQPVTCLLTITNNGPITATNVVWQNRLPDQMIFAGGAGVSATNNVLSGQISALESGASTTFTYQLQATQPGLYINAAQITASDQTDPDSQPNSGTGDGQDDAAQADLRVGANSGPVYASANPDQVPLPPVQSNQPIPDPAKVDLSLQLSVSNRTPKQGDVLTYVLTLTNQGGATASAVNVTAYLPAGQQFESSDTMAPGDGGITGGAGSIAAGSTVTLRFVARVTAAGNGVAKAQIRQASPADADSTPDNGTENGEDDVAVVDVRAVPN